MEIINIKLLLVKRVVWFFLIVVYGIKGAKQQIKIDADRLCEQTANGTPPAVQERIGESKVMLAKSY